MKVGKRTAEKKRGLWLLWLFRVYDFQYLMMPKKSVRVQFPIGNNHGKNMNSYCVWKNEKKRVRVPNSAVMTPWNVMHQWFHRRSWTYEKLPWIWINQSWTDQKSAVWQESWYNFIHPTDLTEASYKHRLSKSTKEVGDIGVKSNNQFHNIFSKHYCDVLCKMKKGSGKYFKEIQKLVLSYRPFLNLVSEVLFFKRQLHKFKCFEKSWKINFFRTTTEILSQSATESDNPFF